MHRVQELKSGGGERAASGCRERRRAGLRHVVRSLVRGDPARRQHVRLAWVDVRLLFGALVVVPFVYFTHRTWIGSIRPQHRRIRVEREEVDALATESFGGIRVVRRSDGSGRRRTASCAATT